jgi:8-oxo-dGTP diphosphatase
MSYTYEYPRPAVTVDALIFKKGARVPRVLLIKRGNEPFKNMWAIPGGFIDLDEELVDAAKRELEEETGIKDTALHEFGVYGAVNRDPRHRTISIAFAGILDDDSVNAVAADDAAEADWFEVNNLPKLAFDHDMIIQDAIKYVKQNNWI